MVYTCDQCGKEFNTTEALEHHTAAKHISTSFPRIKGKYLFYSIVILVFVVIGFMVYRSETAPGKYDELAKCMTQKGIKMYGTFWCTTCAKQKQILGRSMQYIDYVECSTPDKKDQTRICKDEKIERYPTWEFLNNTKVEGIFTINELSYRSGCALNPQQLK